MGTSAASNIGHRGGTTAKERRSIGKVLRLSGVLLTLRSLESKYDVVAAAAVGVGVGVALHV